MSELQQYRVKGHPDHTATVLSGQLTLTIQELVAAGDEAATLIGERALDTAAQLAALWKKHKDNFEKETE